MIVNLTKLTQKNYSEVGSEDKKMNFPYNLNEVLPLGQRDVVKVGHDLLPVGSSSSGSVGGKTFFLLQVTTN